MTIYFDAHLVQFYADCEEFMFGGSDEVPERLRSVEPELRALRRIMEMDDLGDWRYAAPSHLLDELRRGRPTETQRHTYDALEAAWNSTGEDEPTEQEIRQIEATLMPLGLKDPPDRRHLAEAVALGASWFLTNDREVIEKTRGRIPGLEVGRPSECLAGMSLGLFMR